MILVIGGAGYIGSHVVKELVQQNYRVVVLDNLSSGYRESVDIRAVFEYGDYTNLQDLERVFSRYSIDAVMYCVRESSHAFPTKNLLVQIDKQLTSIQALLKMMLAYQVTNFIFSSTPFAEEGTKQTLLDVEVPLFARTSNGYLHALIEQMLETLYQKSALNYIALRYFNAAGAHESGDIGEDRHPEVDVIPQVLLHLLHRTPLTVNIGYDTPDGTYICDYLHVMDVARAHVLALDMLFRKKTHAMYTLGTGCGSSVQEVIQTAEEITGRLALVEFSPLANNATSHTFVSSCTLYEELGWKANYSLEDIITSAWNWHTRYPSGYPSKLEFAL